MFKFREVFKAGLFPNLKSNCFIVVNESEFGKRGSNWILLYCHYNNMYFVDTLSLSVTNFRAVHARLMKYYQHVQDFNSNFPLQQRNSELCGFFCIYVAHVIYTNDFKFNLYMNDTDFLRLATHML